ncbi:hypothetical protein Cob_v003123 [Colletotrichum orbiculare MAFF 240422]|uniref:Uncharacterized protein n=1 Tax=Colletotrichum orbiculare (strain 104-T / ATCC 96160 / CBS 514.97 / LARS 414 / MAFF 240422) TaxID=1213857 RepID=A0A484G1N5_COLOR|nr:hypothetical protein Cob_v003123 [Colletotrichum orbiculare MAFF 240422]
MRTVKPQDLNAARKSLSWLYRGVENYDVERRLQLLVVAVGDQVEVARMKSNVTGFGAASTCDAGVVMSVLTPYMLDGNRWDWELSAAWVYTRVGLSHFVAMWFLIPETKADAPPPS